MYDTPAQPQPAKKKRNTLLIVLVAVFSVLALCLGGALIVGVTADTEKAAKGKSGVTANTRQPAVATTAAAPKPAPVKPAVKDFKLTVKVLKKTCFGSAGCNVTFRIDIAYSGPVLDPSTTYEVVYEVRGGEDPLTNSFKVRGDQASYDQEEHIQIKTSNAALTAVVTEINEL